MYAWHEFGMSVHRYLVQPCKFVVIDMCWHESLDG